MIINADDFGYSTSVNEAILKAFEEGLVSSTSIMANMPAFEEACALAHERKLLSHVGAHLVLTEGEPLTDAIKNCPRFCDREGRFGRRPGPAFWLTPFERRAVQEEVRAQIDRCRSESLPLTHLDSHHHAHNEPAIGRIVSRAARDMGIPFVRIARNCGANIDVPRRLYKAYLNRHLRRLGLARTRYFGEVSDYVYLRAHGASPSALNSFEVMTHPIFDENGRFVDSLAPVYRFHELIAQLDGPGPAVSYAGAAYV